MKSAIVLPVIVGALLSWTPPLDAQGILPFAVEVRGGAAVPSGDLNDVYDAGTGVSYGANVQFPLLALLTGYLGYERTEFDPGDDAGFGSDAKLVDDGFALGGQLALPLGGLLGANPWLRAGATYNRFSRRTDTSQGDAESERDVGFELGGGVAFSLGGIVSVTPGVRFRSSSPTLDSSAPEEGLDVSSFVFDLGLRLGL